MLFDSPIKQSQRESIRTLLLILIITLLFAAMIHRCMLLHMDQSLSPRYWSFAIPALLSEWFYGAASYTYYPDIAAQFAATTSQHVNTFPGIAAAVAHFSIKITRAAQLFPGDEKGTIDFLRLAFLLYGMEVKSVFYLFMTFLSCSLTCFILCYRQHRDVLLIAALTSFAMYVALGAFAVSKEIASVTNPRAIACLSIFALLHLAFAITYPKRLTIWRFSAIFFQALLIILTITIRTAAMWQIIALSVLTIITISRQVQTKKFATFIIRSLMPMLLLLGLLVGYHFYQNTVYPPDYFKLKLRNKIFWHNVLIGFALNPKLAKQYQIAVDDTSVLQLIQKETRLHDPDHYKDIFWADNQVAADSMVKNFNAYEDACKKTTWRIIRNNKYQIAKLYLFYKPRQLWRSLEYASAIPKKDLAFYNLIDQTTSLMSNAERVEKDAFYHPFSLPILLAISFVCFIAGWEAVRGSFRNETIMIIATIGAASLIPALLTYPLIHLLSDFYITFAIVIYSFFVYIIYNFLLVHFFRIDNEL